MYLRSFKRVACALMGAVLTVGSAYAKGPEPALWRIKHGDATVYILGSVHVLPRYWEWRTPAIDKAMAASDAFVFESLMTPEALGKMRVFLRENGTLPRGKHLSQMLSPQGLEDYKAALSHIPVDPDSINVMRPWLAQIVLADLRIETGPNRQSYGEGADFQIEADARRMKKPVRYLESVESVFKILVQAAPDDDLKQFEANLHSMREGSKLIDRLVDRWTAGDQTGLTKLLADDAANHPEEMRMVLNVRNRN